MEYTGDQREDIYNAGKWGKGIVCAGSPALMEGMQMPVLSGHVNLSEPSPFPFREMWVLINKQNDAAENGVYYITLEGNYVRRADDSIAWKIEHNTSKEFVQMAPVQERDDSVFVKEKPGAMPGRVIIHKQPVESHFRAQQRQPNPSVFLWTDERRPPELHNYCEDRVSNPEYARAMAKVWLKAADELEREINHRAAAKD